MKYEWKPYRVPLLVTFGLLPVTLLPSLLAWRWLIGLLGSDFHSVVDGVGAGVTCGLIAWAALINCRPDDRRSWTAAAIAALTAGVLTSTGIVWGGLVTLVETAKGNADFFRWTIFLGGLLPGLIAIVVSAFLFGRRPATGSGQDEPGARED